MWKLSMSPLFRASLVQPMFRADAATQASIALVIVDDHLEECFVSRRGGRIQVSPARSRCAQMDVRCPFANQLRQSPHEHGHTFGIQIDLEAVELTFHMKAEHRTSLSTLTLSFLRMGRSSRDDKPRDHAHGRPHTG